MARNVNSKNQLRLLCVATGDENTIILHVERMRSDSLINVCTSSLSLSIDAIFDVNVLMTQPVYCLILTMSQY